MTATNAVDLNQVGTFVRVMETGSFTAAARELGLPKSSVSRRVSALEQALRVRLLQRSTRKLVLTESGRLYFDRARGAGRPVRRQRRRHRRQQWRGRADPLHRWR